MQSPTRTALEFVSTNRCRPHASPTRSQIYNKRTLNWPLPNGKIDNNKLPDLYPFNPRARSCHGPDSDKILAADEEGFAVTLLPGNDNFGDGIRGVLLSGDPRPKRTLRHGGFLSAEAILAPPHGSAE